MRRVVRLTLLVSFALLASVAARAQCPTPTLTIGPPDSSGNVHILAQANGTCGGSSIQLTLNGTVIYDTVDCTFYNAGPHCKLEFDYNIGCLPNRENVFQANSRCSSGPPENCVEGTSSQSQS